MNESHADTSQQIQIIQNAKALLEDFGYHVISPKEKTEMKKLAFIQSEKIDDLEKRLNHNGETILNGVGQ